MSEATVPSYDAMMQPVIAALRANDGQASNAEICAFVIQTLALPPAAVDRLHTAGSPLTELAYRLQWTRTYLRQYGLIDSPRRGYWLLTEAGWQTETVDVGEIVRIVRGQMQTRAAAKDGQTPIFPELVAQPPAKLHAVTATPGLRSPTPLFPTYTNVRHFLHILEGSNAAAYLGMAGAIWEQRGNPQEQVDWSNPDEWIVLRLAGENQTLAQRLWHDSQRQLNPRYTRGCWYFAAKHNLLTRNRRDSLQITERGRLFISEPAGPLTAEIDAYEGVLTVLRLVAEQGVARRSTLLPGYSAYSRTQTTFQSDNVLKTSLYDRLRNLIDRGLVEARGASYEVTEAGLQYLERFAAYNPEQVKTISKSSELFRMARTITDDVRARLHAYLLEMDAFKFEELIKLLLEEMGYDNVATTSPTNDKGVDLVGTIALGISAVREVIQAKRHKGAINRPVLDQLRGSLHRFNAVRGTIITTGRFSKGVAEAAFERGAAPITLIDGTKLIDLLVENQIGVNTRQVDYLEFAPEKLAHFAPGTEGALNE